MPRKPAHRPGDMIEVSWGDYDRADEWYFYGHLSPEEARRHAAEQVVDDDGDCDCCETDEQFQANHHDFGGTRQTYGRWVPATADEYTDSGFRQIWCCPVRAGRGAMPITVVYRASTEAAAAAYAALEDRLRAMAAERWPGMKVDVGRFGRELGSKPAYAWGVRGPGVWSVVFVLCDGRHWDDSTLPGGELTWDLPSGAFAPWEVADG